MKKILKGIGIVLLAVIVAVGGFVGYLSIKEYKPDEVEEIDLNKLPNSETEVIIEPLYFSGDTLSILSYNTGYSGLGDNADFFMDGGKEVCSTDEERMKQNMNDILSTIQSAKTDFVFLQEVDIDSSRSYGVNQAEFYRDEMNKAHGVDFAFAYNYSCPFVPYPLPPIGKVNSGILTLSNYTMKDSSRYSLPCPFSWPISAANLKRCITVTHIPIANSTDPLAVSEKMLTLVNLHLEAYDDGEGKEAQTKLLISILEEEYKKGDYVIAGGDFNQTFPGALDKYPTKNEELWTPGTLENDILPEGWRFAYDLETPTCRLLNMPYDKDNEETQFYVIDGFILSPNVQLVGVEAIDMQFKPSDHNPVRLDVKLGYDKFSGENN